jgi:hypothetical protein
MPAGKKAKGRNLQLVSYFRLSSCSAHRSAWGGKKGEILYVFLQNRIKSFYFYI